MIKISEQCVGCHNCAMECPRQAIDWVGLKYEIDQDKCIGCGRCVQVCHSGACQDLDAPAAIPHEPVQLDADVVVCGSGCGIAAAVRAAQQGKKVILLEKSAKLGGNTDYAHGFFPVYSAWHKKEGIPDVREDAVKYYYNAANGELDEDVVRTAVYADVEFFDWLCQFGTAQDYFTLVNMGSVDVHGPVYGPGLLNFPKRSYANLLCRDDAIGPGYMGTYVIRTMLDAIEKEDLDVTIYTSTAARHLRLDGAGKICGVEAEDAGGKVSINCKAVILATGGFGKSDEKLEKYFKFFDCETRIHRFSVPGDTGDGIDMLRELGVEPPEEKLFCSIFGPKHHPFSNVLADIALEPQMVDINRDGRRWMNEAMPFPDMQRELAKQPGEYTFTVANRDFFASAARRFLTDPFFADKTELYETWEDELEEESRLDTPVKKGETLEELEALCKMPAGSLRRALERYNGFCAKGVDEDFGKDAKFLKPIDLDRGPYYGIYCQRFSEAAMGGLRVNGKCQVLRGDDKTVIPGLYGVGDATSAMHRRGKLAVISELTWGTASAYVSGNNAVRYIDGQEEL